MAMGEDVKVREAINQGFVRAELATSMDDHAKRVYQTSKANFMKTSGHADALGQLKSKAEGAITNYMAAISCFLRTVPKMKDWRSSQLIRTEVDRLLKRLEEMRVMAKRAENMIQGLPEDEGLDTIRKETPTIDSLARELDIEDTRADTPIIHMAEFADGSLVDVAHVLDEDDLSPATVVAFDADLNSYTVRYDAANTEETDVDPSRLHIRTQPDPDDIDDSLNLAARFSAVCELIEEERKYVRNLRNLDNYFLHVLTNPAHWGGQREADETMFTGTTIRPNEARTLFGNLPEIIGMHESFLKDLEQAFAQWPSEHMLAHVFIRYAPFFKSYTTYSVTFESGQALLESIKGKRQGLASAEALAERDGIAPLDELLRKPLGRMQEYVAALQRLKERTPADATDAAGIDRAIELIGVVAERIAESVHRSANQRKVMEIQRLFRPSLELVAPHRIFRLYGKLGVMEEHKMKQRHFWLFNDILVCARTSEWFAVGSYRLLRTITIRQVMLAPEFGPLAFKIMGGSSQSNTNSEAKTWVLQAPKKIVLDEWMQALRRFTNVTTPPPQMLNRKLTELPTTYDSTERPIVAPRPHSTKCKSQNPINAGSPPLPVPRALKTQVKSSPATSQRPERSNSCGSTKSSNQHVVSSGTDKTNEALVQNSSGDIAVAANKEKPRIRMKSGGSIRSRRSNGSMGDVNTLPTGWTKLIHRASNKPYYYHAADQRTTWVRPVRTETEPFKVSPMSATPSKATAAPTRNLEERNNANTNRASEKTHLVNESGANGAASHVSGRGLQAATRPALDIVDARVANAYNRASSASHRDIQTDTADVARDAEEDEYDVLRKIKSCDAFPAFEGAISPRSNVSVLSSDWEADAKASGVGLFEFVPESEGELAFAAGEKLWVSAADRKQPVDGWVTATNANGCSGLVPVDWIQYEQ